MALQSNKKFFGYVRKNELDPVGATNNLRGLATKIKLIDETVSSSSENVNTEISDNSSKASLSSSDADDLAPVTPAGSKEAKELEKVKKLFAEAYRAETKNTTGEDGVRYGLEQVDDIYYVRAEKGTFVKEDGTLASEREIFNSLVGTLHLPDGDIEIVKRLPDKDMYNELSRRYPKKLDNISDVKQLNSDVNRNMKELLTNSDMKTPNVPDVDGKHARQGVTSFDTRTVKFYDGVKAYTIEFSIATLQSGKKVAYAKKFFGYDADLTKKIQAAEARSEQSPLNQQSASVYSVSPSAENVNKEISSLSQEELKSKQLDIILNSNPANNTYSTWIRDVSDIKTFEETLQDSDWDGWEENAFDPDYTPDMVQEALDSGKITVYSSYPIEQGIFVTPSRMEAESYSGDGKVYSKTVDLKDVAWIDPTQGQYAKVDNGTKSSLSSSDADDLAPVTPTGTYNVYGKDIALEDEMAPVVKESNRTSDGKNYITLEDYANLESPVWRNVEYSDEETKASITQDTHNQMVSSGKVVTVTDDVMSEVGKSFPDLRSIKKSDRTPILKDAMGKLKSKIRQFLTDLSNQNFEFEVNGKVLEARLYSTGINEVLEKVTQEKADMLYSTEEIFRNAQYLYSTPDYDGDPNIYRWNYFYTPVQIGEEIVGVRIAVRDVAKGVGMTPESQIYNWNIKKDTSLDGGRRGPRVASSSVSSDVPIKSIPEQRSIVKSDDFAPAQIDFDDILDAEDKQTDVAQAAEATQQVDEGDTPMPDADQSVANVLTEEPQKVKKKPNAWSMLKRNVIDRGTVFETMSLKTGNQELQAKYKAIGRAENSAQWLMEHGNAETKSLKSIIEEVERSGKTKEFSDYMYHLLNVDRMTLEERYDHAINMPVFGGGVTAETSRQTASELENANPEFKQWAEDVYAYVSCLRKMMVDNGIITQETADLWTERYPHYIPIRRAEYTDSNTNIPHASRVDVNAPIKRLTGGSSAILPLFNTLATRTEQTFKAVAKNNFGVELKNMMGTTLTKDTTSLDESIDSVEIHDDLLQEGKDGKNPTFTVFENGEKVTFEITEEMYDDLKPKSKEMSYTNKVLNAANNVRRGLLSEYSPAFLVTNPIKDIQDVLINSKHPVQTYANFPRAIAELWNKSGQYYREYMEHGGEYITFFEKDTNTFAREKSALQKVVGFPFDKISGANNFIERIPRMAEYIASRKAGRSIDVAMLDAARVTTDFSAGGDLTKFANRNGFTFLNASVQGAVQQVRNIREAKAEGLKGWAKLAAKVIVAGMSSILLNNLLWDDDDDYEELSDYVKQNYWIVGKYGDGKFVQIPKGRAVAVIQNAFEQMGNLITGNDELDFETFAELVVNNLAPNNPMENNLLAPISQAVNNETWYGEDLVPTRLQDLPAEEQYDETTDSISRWLGEKLNISPYKINYVLDQYSGAVGDIVLPMLTTEAERGNDSWLGYFLAPIANQFTSDSVMKNQNVSDFYTMLDELTTNAKASGATDEDVLKNKYMNSVNSELSDLYAQKRKIQNSDLTDAEKYYMIRELQKQINAKTEESLNTYEDVTIDGKYANIGDRYFEQDEDGVWSKMSDAKVAKWKATTAAGDSNYATDGVSHWQYSESDEGGEWSKLNDAQVEKQEIYTQALNVSAEDYWQYMSELNNIKADKDKNGKTISGSRKEKVIKWLENLDADYGTKIILFRSEYKADDTYNEDIIKYLKDRKDISDEEMKTILAELEIDDW